MISVEQLVEWELAWETEVVGENLPKYHFVHHKSHMNWPGLERGKPATNRLSYGTASTNRLQLKQEFNCTVIHAEHTKRNYIISE
jgi:hypothetical protein